MRSFRGDGNEKIWPFAALLTGTLLFLSVLAAAPLVNDHISREIARELADLPLPPDTELVETVYKAGKLVGNGNGMQYFGAILIKSELPLEDLKEQYSRFSGNQWECVVESQTEADITVIEHTKRTFKTDIAGKKKYYIVYSWGDNKSIFHELDIRGH